MEQMGMQFQQKRKEMNLSLKEVENATSIRTAYLQAIEEEHLHELISPVYAQGFVKQYANFLGIDGEEFIKQHPEIFQKKEDQEFAYGIGTLEARSISPRSTDGGRGQFVLGAAFLLFMLALAWYLAKYLEVL